MPAVFVCPAAKRATSGNETSQKDYGINGGTQAGGCCNERNTTTRDGMAWLGVRSALYTDASPTGPATLSCS